MIYRGLTNNPSKTLKTGLFEWRIIYVAPFERLQLRLLKPPSAQVTLQGTRFGWVGGWTSVVNILATWDTNDWNTWKEIDYQSSTASHLFYLDSSVTENFYRVSFYTRTNEYTSLLFEIY